MNLTPLAAAVRTLAAVGMLLIATACNDEPPSAQPPSSENMPMTQPPLDQPEIGAIEQSAVTDLARRLVIDPDRIEVVSAQAVTWSDGSIGCPQPDGLYTQALVEGFHVVLAADGDEYHYHAGRDRAPFYCPEERRRTPIGAGRARY